MKNATRILALVFVLAMVLTCFAGMLTTASAADAPTPNAVYDFGDAATVAGIGTVNTCAFEQRNGYTRVTGSGVDSWFVLNPASTSPIGGEGTTGSMIDYVVIKYRTNTSGASAQFYCGDSWNKTVNWSWKYPYQEYSSEWKMGDEPYYPINNDRNNELYAKYKELADNTPNVIFGGRLGQYKYYDMDKVIISALDAVKAEFGE